MLLLMALFHFFFMAEQYRLCMFTDTHTHMHIYHVFFIQVSINGHLGYFHVLAVVDSAAMNTIFQFFVYISILLKPSLTINNGL